MAYSGDSKSHEHESVAGSNPVSPTIVRYGSVVQQA
jgi:hypothetical protein